MGFIFIKIELIYDKIYIGVIMEIINTIDLWTEQKDNHLECFQGAFIDGFESGIPFDSYRVIKNCNCIITSNAPINITNKHQAVIFYKNNIPVRLFVINKNTEIDKLIDMALNQEINGNSLRDIYDIIGIKRDDLDYQQEAIINNKDHNREVDVGSCDRETLLNSMLEGSYTESDTGFGKNINTDFIFVPGINIQYDLLTSDYRFMIDHSFAFVNKDGTRIIPLQNNSHLDIEQIYEEYYNKDKLGIKK